MSSSMWWSWRAVKIHVTAVVVVPGCLAFCWWQVERATSGNELSWAYVFEWPIFAGYAVFMWWRLIHENPHRATGARAPLAGARTGETAGGTEGIRPKAPAGPGGPGGGDDGHRPAEQDTPGGPEEEEREAYNRYLAELDTYDRRSR